MTGVPDNAKMHDKCAQVQQIGPVITVLCILINMYYGAKKVHIYDVTEERGLGIRT